MLLKKIDKIEKGLRMANFTKKEMTVEEITKILSNAYVRLIKKGLPIKTFPSAMLWGAPGVGKSQGVKQIAKEIEFKTNKKVVVTDVRLLLFNPVDLRGIPTSNAEKTLAVWLKPQIFQMDESENVINILFLDEISAAPPSVQAAAYQITLDRVIGEHKLPENCVVIAAGNRVSDKSVAYKMPRALANRLLHLEVCVDSGAWQRWAATKGINHIVTGFLAYNPTCLIDSIGEDDANAFPTPRSWEMVSNILDTMDNDLTQAYPLICGCVGSAVADELVLWAEVFNKIASPEDICAGASIGMPLRLEAIYASVSSLVKYLKDNHTLEQVDNAIRYVAKIPQREFRQNFFSYLYQMKEVRKVATKNSAFADWLNKNGLYEDD